MPPSSSARSLDCITVCHYSLYGSISSGDQSCPRMQLEVQEGLTIAIYEEQLVYMTTRCSYIDN